MFTRADLEAAVAAGVIDNSSFEKLDAFLAARGVAPTSFAQPVRFDLSHLLWYAGALIVMGAMGLFSTTAFSMMGGKALTLTAAIYAISFVFAGHILWFRRDLRTPGGLLIACAVAMAPLAVFGIQDWAGWWIGDVKPGTVRDYYIWIKGGWVPMEVATAVAAAIAVWFYPYPFIIAVASLALWFFAMDIAELVVDRGNMNYTSYWDLRRSVTQWFGLAVIVLAWVIDMKKRSADFAFWLHLAGILAFWGAVTSQSSNSEIAKAIYCAMNVGLLLLAVFLERRVYAVFGAIGVTLYLGDLANRVFKDSLLFPFALTLIGLAIIGAGILYFRNREAILAAVERSMPAALARLRPAHAAGHHVVSGAQ